MEIIAQTPEAKHIYEHVTMLMLPTIQGPVGILPGHAPMVLQVTTGIVHIHQENGVRDFFTNPGIASIGKDSCSLFTERLRTLDELDPLLLEEKLQGYHDDLAGLEFSEEQRFIERQILITRAMLEAVKRKNLSR